MRIRGRRLYPDTLAERRFMMAELGGVPLYAPRGISPYVLARRITRLASGQSPDLAFLRERLGARPLRPVTAIERSAENSPSATQQTEATGAAKPVAA
jgi:hypothetical protein